MYRPKHRKRYGRCYELAYLVMLKSPITEALTLVHGRLSTARFPEYPHAWIETTDGQVYDPVSDTLEPAARAVVHRRYSLAEVCDLVGRPGHDHYGPWHVPPVGEADGSNDPH